MKRFDLLFGLSSVRLNTVDASVFTPHSRLRVVSEGWGLYYRAGPTYNSVAWVHTMISPRASQSPPKWVWFGTLPCDATVMAITMAMAMAMKAFLKLNILDVNFLASTREA